MSDLGKEATGSLVSLIKKMDAKLPPDTQNPEPSLWEGGVASKLPSTDLTDRAQTKGLQKSYSTFVADQQIGPGKDVTKRAATIESTAALQLPRQIIGQLRNSEPTAIKNEKK